MEQKNRVISYFERLGELSAAHTETADTIVPDNAPDILKILGANATVCLRDKTVQPDRALLSGTAQVNILYAPEDGSGMRCLTVPVSFAHVAEIRGLAEGDSVIAWATPAGANARMVNSRKASAEMKINLYVRAYRKMQKNAGIELSGADDTLCTLEKKETVTLPFDIRQKNFSVMEDLELSPGSEPIGQIVRSDISFAADEAKALTNKALVRGNVVIDGLYTSKDGDKLHRMEFMIPFTQIFDIDGLNENAAVTPRCTLRSFELTPVENAGEAGGLSASIGAEMTVLALRKQDIAYLADAYSLRRNVRCEHANLALPRASGTLTLRGEAEKTAAGDAQARTVLTCAGFCSAFSLDGAIARAEVSAQAVYAAEDGQLGLASAVLPVEIPVADGVEGLRVSDCDVKTSAAVTADGGISFACVVTAAAERTGEAALSPVSALAIDEEHEKAPYTDAGIILCYPTPGEDCWALAKKYNTTCRHILDANGLEDGAHIRPGELVLIPISQ